MIHKSKIHKRLSIATKI